MSAKSMTGYGRSEAISEHYQLTVEIKSVNHRFRDVRFKMHSLFSREEIPLKKKIEGFINRGSLDVHVIYKTRSDENRFDDLDMTKVTRFLESMQGFAKEKDVAMQIRPCDFLRPEFMRDKDTEKFDELRPLLNKAFDEALSALMGHRSEEGLKLKGKITEDLKAYEKHYKGIYDFSKKYQSVVEKKLRDKFQDFKNETNIDETRFLQEVIYYLEKLDISEELSRIEIHLEKMHEVFNLGKPIGRQIDFLIQELNRETNTIGSKSNLSEISNAVVKMKVQLEKIREQALNIE